MSIFFVANVVSSWNETVYVANKLAELSGKVRHEYFDLLGKRLLEVAIYSLNF